MRSIWSLAAFAQSLAGKVSIERPVLGQGLRVLLAALVVQADAVARLIGDAALGVLVICCAQQGEYVVLRGQRDLAYLPADQHQRLAIAQLPGVELLQVLLQRLLAAVVVHAGVGAQPVHAELLAGQHGLAVVAQGGVAAGLGAVEAADLVEDEEQLLVVAQVGGVGGRLLGPDGLAVRADAQADGALARPLPGVVALVEVLLASGLRELLVPLAPVAEPVVGLVVIDGEAGDHVGQVEEAVQALLVPALALVLGQGDELPRHRRRRRRTGRGRAPCA